MTDIDWVHCVSRTEKDSGHTMRKKDNGFESLKFIASWEDVDSGKY